MYEYLIFQIIDFFQGLNFYPISDELIIEDIIDFFKTQI